MTMSWLGLTNEGSLNVGFPSQGGHRQGRIIVSNSSRPPSSYGPTDQEKFEQAMDKAKSALWRPGLSVVLILDGTEHEFAFNASRPEHHVLSRLRARNIAVGKARTAGTVAFLFGLLGLITIAAVFLLQ